MTRRALIVGFAAGSTLVAADKKGPITCKGSNTDIKVEGLALLDKESIKQALGSDMGGYVALVEVTVTPRAGKPIKIFIDDFTLLSHKDGQRSQPFAPSQLAGKGGIMLTQTSNGAGAFMGNQNGPVWGGIDGRPRRMGGDGGQIGNTSTTTSTDAKVQDTKEREDPMLAVLKQKSLPESETDKPVKGYLYFPLDGKHKAKDLTMIYKGQAGKLTMEFQ